MKTKEGLITAAEDISSYRLVKLSSAQVVHCDQGEIPIGLSRDGVTASGNECEFDYIDGSAFTVVGATALVAGCDLYPADNGQVSDVAVGKKIGTLLTTITAAGRTGTAYLSGTDGGNDQFSAMKYAYDWREDFVTGYTEDGGKFSETADKAHWLKSSVDGDTDGGDVCKVADDGPAGLLQLTCNNKDADSENIQLNGEAFKPATGKPLYFEASVALLDVDKCDFFIGLAVADVDILGGVTDRIGFQNDHDGNIDALIEQDNTEYKADTLADIADCAAVTSFATYKKHLAFFWDGAGVIKFFVDGVLTNTFTDNGSTILVPDDETLSPVVQIKTHTGAGAVQTAWIDYLHITGTR
jgi:hypothetical protein